MLPRKFKVNPPEGLQITYSPSFLIHTFTHLFPQWIYRKRYSSNVLIFFPGFYNSCPSDALCYVLSLLNLSSPTFSNWPALPLPTPHWPYNWPPRGCLEKTHSRKEITSRYNTYVEQTLSVTSPKCNFTSYLTISLKFVPWDQRVYPWIETWDDIMNFVLTLRYGLDSEIRKCPVEDNQYFNFLPKLNLSSLPTS